MLAIEIYYCTHSRFPQVKIQFYTSLEHAEVEGGLHSK